MCLDSSTKKGPISPSSKKGVIHTCMKKECKWYNGGTTMWKDLLTIFGGLVALVGLIFIPLTPLPAYAIEVTNPFGNHPFGGKILDKTSCNCPLPYGTLIDVGPPRGGSFLFVGGVTSLFGIGSKLYEYKALDEGNWVLGLAKGPPLPCTQWTLTGQCKEEGQGSYISIIGTSDNASLFSKLNPF